MKKLMIKFGGTIAAFALMVASFDVNTNCTLFAYQPKLPENAKKLRKF